MQKGVPQIMDITSIKSVLHDLSKEVLPSRFETAQQPENNIIQFCLRGIRSQTWIEVSWNSDSPRILKIKKPEKKVQKVLYQAIEIRIKVYGFSINRTREI